MRADIARLDLGLRRRSTIGYTAGLVLYALAVVALYPAFKHSSSLDSLIHNDATAAALFGVSGSISSSAGWLNGNLYANLVPLIILFVTIGYGAAALAGQDEEGTLCLIATLPLTRRAIVAQKLAAMATQAVIVAVAVAACVIIGRSFQLTTTPAAAISTSLAVVIMALDFGLVAMAVGALSGRRGTAIGVATAIAAASYLVSSLAPVVAFIRPARYASLLYWSVGDNQLAGHATVADFAVLATVGIAGVIATIAAFVRQDLH